MTRHTSPQKQESTKAAIAPSSNPLAPRPFAQLADAVKATPESQLVDSPPIEFSVFSANGGSLPSMQLKLTIGAPNDPYEQEADRVATQVVQQINAPQAKHPQALQRDALLDDEELQLKPMLQREVLPEEKELQMKSIPSAGIVKGDAAPDLESAIARKRGSGQALDPSLQTLMGQAMGADFSDVRVHTDSQSDQLNRSIQAKAFTTGQDVFFRQGAYQPGSQGGQELIAHELTHVVQQNGEAVQRSSQPKQTLHPIESQNVKARLGLQKNNLNESMLQAKWSGDIPVEISDAAMKSRLTEVDPAAKNIPLWRIEILRNDPKKIYTSYQQVLEHFDLGAPIQPRPRVEQPAPRVETSAPRVETPAPRIETPAPRIETSTKKVVAPVKKEASLQSNSLIPKNLELKNLIRGDNRDRHELISEGFKPGKAVKDYFNKLKVFLDNLTSVKKSEEISKYMKDREPNKAILNPEAKLHQQIDLVWSRDKIEVSGGRKISLLNYVCTGLDSGAGGNNYLIKVDEVFECISASPTLGLYQSGSGLQVLAMASSASAGKEGEFVKFHEYDFLTPIPPDKIYYASKDGGTTQEVSGGTWFNVVTGHPL